MTASGAGVADLAAAKAAFTTLVAKDVPAFNKAGQGKLPPIADGCSICSKEP
jgi:hypothetical protein